MMYCVSFYYIEEAEGGEGSAVGLPVVGSGLLEVVLIVGMREDITERIVHGGLVVVDEVDVFPMNERCR